MSSQVLSWNYFNLLYKVRHQLISQSWLGKTEEQSGKNFKALY